MNSNRRATTATVIAIVESTVTKDATTANTTTAETAISTATEKAATRRQSTATTAITAETTTAQTSRNNKIAETIKMATASFEMTTTAAVTSFAMIRLEIGVEITGHGTNVGLVSFNNKHKRVESG